MRSNVEHSSPSLVDHQVVADSEIDRALLRRPRLAVSASVA
jgi:hypothetical protein